MKKLFAETVGVDHHQHPPYFHQVFSSCLVLLVVIPLLVGCQPGEIITLAFLGDINLGRDVKADLESFSCLENHLISADYVLANLESPLGKRMEFSTTGYNLCAPVERASLLVEWGLDLLSLANNHENDCSPMGLQETQSALETVGLVGIISQPYHVDHKGLGITFFTFDDIAREMDLPSAVEAISAAHSSGTLVVVSMHWGMEYQGAPSDRQKYIAGILADAGADVIWGHHPHVLQPVEWLETSRGHTLVLYSLGNALFDQGGLEDTRQSALLLVYLGVGGVQSVEVIPFAIDVPSSRIITPSVDSTKEILFRLAIPGDLLPSR